VIQGGIQAMLDLTTVWREVCRWPAEQRWALATRLLQSLQQEMEPVAISPERQQALLQLIGLWKTDQPPTDEQVEQILEQERMKKYG
jgi:hypothetical protein